MTQIISKKTEKNTQATKKARKKTFIRKSTSDTFWNKLRQANNYSYDELSEVLGGGLSKICAYFTGRAMPSRTFSDKCSDLFGVDRTEGYKHFQAGFEVYHNTHGKSIKVDPNKNNPIVNDAVSKYLNKPEEKTEIIKVPMYGKTKTQVRANREHDKLLASLFGSMQNTDFIELVHQIDEGSVDWNLTFEKVYGKVSMETFLELIKLKG